MISPPYQYTLDQLTDTLEHGAGLTLAVMGLRHGVDSSPCTGYGRGSRSGRGVGLVRRAISMFLVAYFSLLVSNTEVRGWGRVGPMFWARPPPKPTTIPLFIHLPNINSSSLTAPWLCLCVYLPSPGISP